MKTATAALTALSLAGILLHPAFCVLAVAGILSYLTLDLLEEMQV